MTTPEAAADTPITPPTRPPAAHRCGNCESPLAGPYCAVCGQHAHASARNLAAVMHDAWHDVTHVDGRLWHTLWLLFRKPGGLTVEYFRERRARYLPPVRLYLVLSLVFFTTGIRGDHRPGSGHAGTSIAAELASAAQDEEDKDAAQVAAKVAKAADSPLPCEKLQIAGIAALERMAREACVRNVADHGVSFVRTLLHNIPKMMFVFLPLMAGIMSLLYWRPRRYYVEHLVFLLHNHSALFLCFVLLELGGAVAGLWKPLSSLVAAGGITAVFYVMWYPYAAMRRYYAQGRALTLSKYAVIVFAYFICLLVTLAGTALVTALGE